MDTTQTFDEIMGKITNKFINDINIIGEDDVYYENGWNSINIVFKENTDEQMTIPVTVYLKELQSTYEFDFKVKSERVFDEESMNIQIHMPNKE